MKIEKRDLEQKIKRFSLQNLKQIEVAQCKLITNTSTKIAEMEDNIHCNSP